MQVGTSVRCIEDKTDNGDLAKTEPCFNIYALNWG